MLCEIPIPDGWKFAGYRIAKADEYIMDGIVPFQFCEDSSVEHIIIIRKQWQPPDFLPEGWIAMDEDKEWFWYDQKPTKADVSWCVKGVFLNIGRLIWDRPPVTDWKESLREIKRNQAQPKVAL